MLTVSDIQCTGCTACGCACPREAIGFEVRDGFRYPVVDNNKCNDCNLCMKRCPSVGFNAQKNPFPSVYAAWIKDTDQRIACTSGGIVYEISKNILEAGGCVAGVAWTDHYRNARYELIRSIDDLPRITQTKYFQPEMSEVFIQIKRALDAGENVLFVGTSCANAGLIAYLNRSYENLYCIDFICRGYTTQKYHEKRIIDLEAKEQSSVTGVYYKDKTFGWEKFGTKFCFQNGSIYYINRDDDPYELMLQDQDYLTRTSCFDCKYRESRRITDLTVGDFWGIENVEPDAHKKGVSAVLINSGKGQVLFDGVNGQIYKSERSLWDVAKGNHCLLNQLPFNEGREVFYRDLDALSIDGLHEKYGNLKKLKKKKGKQKIKRAISILMSMNPFVFIHYNYFHNSVVRQKGAYIFPFRGTKLNIEKGSELLLSSNLILNSRKHKRSREETYFHMYPASKLVVGGRAQFAASSTIDILPSAEMELGKLDANYNTVIICSNKIVIGDGAEIGRNVTIYDSNYHATGLSKTVRQRPLMIGKHVWLCTGVCIAKGVKIGDGAMCGIGSTITRNVKERTLVMGNPAKTIMEDVEW